MDGLDLRKNTCSSVKNQIQMIKLIFAFIQSLLNWIQNLVQQLPNSFARVSNIQLDLILSRFNFQFLMHALSFTQTIDFDQVNEYEELRKNGSTGFANLYLWRCDVESKSDDQMDIHVYSQLVKLDSRLGTTASEQLTKCLEFTTQSDIIKVLISTLYKRF